MTGCTHWLDGDYCGAIPTRHHLPGARCAAHTPAALAGRPDDAPDPEWSITAGYALSGWHRSFNRNDTALIDNRARNSGKRASGQQRRASHAT